MGVAKDRQLGGEFVKRFGKTPEFVKARGMTLYAEYGPTEAARRMGVNRRTIERWRHELGIPSRKTQPVNAEDIEKAVMEQEHMRIDIRLLLLQKSRLLLHRVDDDTDPENARFLAQAVGVLLDKFKQETHASMLPPTDGRMADVDGLSPKERQELMRSVSRELREHAARTATGDSAEPTDRSSSDQQAE